MADDSSKGERAPILVVKALAAAPLTRAAVREMLSMADAPAIAEDQFTEVTETVWGWGFTQLVCDAVVTRHGHVLYYDDAPVGNASASAHLVFGQVYPFLAECADDEAWLTGLVRDWGAQPGWRFIADPSVDECEAVLAHAVGKVEELLGRPLRIVRSDEYISMGPHLLCRIWRLGDRAVIVGPICDNGPYGYLSHLAVSTVPWPCDAPLPTDDTSLRRWVRDRVDW